MHVVDHFFLSWPSETFQGQFSFIELILTYPSTLGGAYPERSGAFGSGKIHLLSEKVKNAMEKKIFLKKCQYKIIQNVYRQSLDMVS